MAWDRVGTGRLREFMKKTDKMCLKNLLNHSWFFKTAPKMNPPCGKAGNSLLRAIERIFEKHVYQTLPIKSIFDQKLYLNFLMVSSMTSSSDVTKLTGVLTPVT